jgi:Bacterial Ig domain
MNTYQSMLRALGAYLDEEPSCRITLAELPDGFLIRVRRALHSLDPQVLHFTRTTLDEQLNQFARLKRSAGPRVPSQGVWSRFPNGHQDFLRALGYELDQVSAQSIFIDELEDGFIVTYSCPEVPDNSTWIKKAVIMGLQDIETILNVAFERRLPSKSASQKVFGQPGQREEVPSVPAGLVVESVLRKPNASHEVPQSEMNVRDFSLPSVESFERKAQAPPIRETTPDASASQVQVEIERIVPNAPADEGALPERDQPSARYQNETDTGRVERRLERNDLEAAEIDLARPAQPTANFIEPESTPLGPVPDETGDAAPPPLGPPVEDRKQPAVHGWHHPVITDPADGSTVRGGPLQISGTATPGHVVQVFDWLMPVAGTVAADDGSWSVVVEPASQEDHAFTVSATDPEGRTSVRSDLCVVSVRGERGQPRRVGGRLAKTLTLLKGGRSPGETSRRPRD